MDLKLFAILLKYMVVYTLAFEVRPSLVPSAKEQSKNDKPNDRILNGFTPGQFDVPWVVFLQIQFPQGSSSCSATLISSSWVLTAGHCANTALAIQVQLGLYNRNIGPAQVIDVPASRIFVNPNFITNAVINDIALLQLNPRANTFLPTIQPITYPCPTSGNFAGRIGRACGWGITNDSNTQITTIIQCVDMPVITNQECQLTWGNGVTSTNVCTRNVNFHTVCHGDSGGPLVVVDGPLQRLKLIGATSFGSHPCATTAPGVFTRVPSYYDWIARTTGVICDTS